MNQKELKREAKKRAKNKNTLFEKYQLKTQKTKTVNVMAEITHSEPKQIKTMVKITRPKKQ